MNVVGINCNNRLNETPIVHITNHTYITDAKEVFKYSHFTEDALDLYIKIIIFTI